MTRLKKILIQIIGFMLFLTIFISILIASYSGSGKTNVLLNLMKHQQRDIDKIYLYGNDSFQSKYQLLINGREKVGIKKLKKSKRIY